MLAVRQGRQAYSAQAGDRQSKATTPGLEHQSNNIQQKGIPKATQQHALECHFVLPKLPPPQVITPPSPPPPPRVPGQVIDAINALARGKKDNTATAAEGAVITDAGQLRKGTYTPDLAQM